MKVSLILTLVYLIGAFECLNSIKETKLYLNGEKLNLSIDASFNIQVVYFVHPLNGQIDLETIISLDEYYDYLNNYKIETALVMFYSNE